MEHGSATADPRLFAYWESLRRNEADHRDLLVAWLQQHGASRRRGAVVSALGYARDLASLRDDLDFEEAAVKRYGQMANEAREPRSRSSSRSWPAARPATAAACAT